MNSSCCYNRFSKWILAKILASWVFVVLSHSIYHLFSDYMMACSTSTSPNFHHQNCYHRSESVAHLVIFYLFNLSICFPKYLLFSFDYYPTIISDFCIVCFLSFVNFDVLFFGLKDSFLEDFCILMIETVWLLHLHHCFCRTLNLSYLGYYKSSTSLVATESYLFLNGTFVRMLISFFVFLSQV